MSDASVFPKEEEREYAYQAFVLLRMLEQLPTPLKILLLPQLSLVNQAREKRDNALKQWFFNLRQELHSKFDDLELTIKAMEFDLHATKNERDYLRKIVDDMT